MNILLRISLGFLILLVVLLVLMALMGALLPREHTATRAAKFRQGAAALYAAASDFATQPSWREGLQSVELLPPQDGQVRYREVSGRRAVTYLVTENDPGKKLTVKISDEDLPFGGSWTFEFIRDADSTLVRITERGEIKNILFRFMARFIFGYTSSVESYLRNLGGKFGENITIKS